MSADPMAVMDAVERGQKTAPRQAGPVLVNLATVKPRQVEWLWPWRIPQGKLTMLCGDPGLGKSFATIDVAARVSTGTPWPDCRDIENRAGGVILMSAEDDLEDTIKPRLDAAGADTGRINALTTVRLADGKMAPFSFECDIPILEQAIEETPDCRLVIVDPISSYTGGLDSHKNAETRGMFAPLAELAVRQRVSVLFVTHLSKTAGVNAIYRASGSLAFIAMARAAWLVTKDQESPLRRLMLPLKNNLAKDIQGLAYSIRDGALAWESGPVTISPEEALAPPPRIGDKLPSAIDWLRDALAAGPVNSADLEASAISDGIVKKTLWRASKELGVDKRKVGFGGSGGWTWSLPIDSHPSEKPWLPLDGDAENQVLGGPEGIHSPIDGQVCCGGNGELSAGPQDAADLATIEATRGQP